MAKSFPVDTPAPAEAPPSAPAALPPISFGPRPVGAGGGRKIKPFMLAAHPRRWTRLEADGRLHTVPCLRNITLVGAAGGVRLMRGGGYDVSGLRDNLEGNGWTILPPALGYCIETAPGSGSYRPMWGTVLPDGTVREDGEAYVRWVLGLMVDGTLPSPTPEDELMLDERNTTIALHPGSAQIKDALLRQVRGAA